MSDRRHYLVACKDRCGKPHRVSYSADGCVEMDYERKTIKLVATSTVDALVKALTEGEPT